MIKGVLDTNIITALFKGNPDCVLKYEDYLNIYGTVHFSTILDIDRSVVEKASELYVDLKKKGKLIQDADILIAATAMVHDLGVVTANLEHFSRINGLNVENWLA